MDPGLHERTLHVSLTTHTHTHTQFAEEIMQLFIFSRIGCLAAATNNADSSVSTFTALLTDNYLKTGVASYP
jgi:hypothetical protein